MEAQLRLILVRALRAGPTTAGDSAAAEPLDPWDPALDACARRGPVRIVSSPAERCLRIQRFLADRCRASLSVDARLAARDPSRASAVVDVLDELAAELLAARATDTHPEAIVILHNAGVEAAFARALDLEVGAALRLEPGRCAALDWPHPAAREFRPTWVAMAFDGTLPPPAQQPPRFPGGASVLPIR